MVNNIFCIECGFELPSTAKFCKKCGVEIDAVEAPAEVEPKIKQDKQPSTQPVTETPTQKIFSMGGGFLQLIIIFICGGVGGVIGGLIFGSIGGAVVTIVGVILGKIMAKGILGLIFSHKYEVEYEIKTDEEIKVEKVTEKEDLSENEVKKKPMFTDDEKGFFAIFAFIIIVSCFIWVRF